MSAISTAACILGLPSETRAWGKNDVTLALDFVSKVTYAYDQGNFGDATLNQNISTATRHDYTNYGQTFIAGRANLTATTRCDVTISGQTPNSTCGNGVTSSVKYNTTGAVVSQTDPMGRVSRIGYTDNFNSTGNPATFAYPTTVTDPAGTSLGDSLHSSTVKYRYDIGANVWAQSPAPQGQTVGKTTEREYDDKGRLIKDKIVNHGGAYTRYEYPTNGVQSKVFSTIIDTNSNNTGDSADEVLSESWTDGAGRVRRSRTEHPGSIGGWSASIVEYDKLGRVAKQSVPTEVSVPDPNNPDTWAPAGDDNRGPGVWLWTYQKYDWKNRVIRKINTDGIDQATYNDSDVLINYEGCGCAGGQVTTIQSENVPRDDQPTVNARRTQKVYEDILGRSWKTVVMKWDGTTAYTTTEQKFNGRDQVLKTIQTDNVSNPIKTQEVTMTYDGHGRMKTRHYPIEDSLAYTEWIYNADDSIQQVIDPRLAITTFTYGDPRGLMTQVSYSVPNGSTIPVTPTTTFAYDNLGNRTSMATAGVNTTTYTYDQLSRMTSETVDFDALANNLTIGYTYNLSGGLKSITDPFNSTVNYTNDRGGRLTAVTGTAYAQNTTGDYASNIKYRAFGQVKQMDYDLPNGDSQIKLEYDSRLRVNHSEATQAGSTSSFLMKADYSYSADSRMQAKNDLLNDSWDRTMKYDFAGRLKFNQFGTGVGSDGYTQKLVYEQTLAFDSFSNMTSRTTTHWDTPNSFTATYTNGRQDALTGETLTFAASGNIVVSQPDTNNPHNVQTTTFDASGRRTKFNGKTKGRQGGYLNYVSEDITEQVFDGDGRPVVEKTGHRSYHIYNVPTSTLTADPRGYQIWSSVLGSVLTSVLPSGTKSLTNVYAGSAVIARQNRYTESSTNYDSISWRTADPVAGTVGWFNYSSEGSASGTEETEPLGQNLHKTDPTDYTPPANESFIGNAGDPQWQCEEKNASWLWGEFHKWPVSCQTRHMQEATVTVYDYSTDKKENPQGIVRGLTDSPLPADYTPDTGLAYASKQTMSSALTSSSKGTMNLAFTDWVLLNGEMFFDSRVVDEATAKELYGDGVKYYPVNYEYVDSNGAKIVLLAGGEFTKNGIFFNNGDRASSASTNPPTETPDRKAPVIPGTIVPQMMEEFSRTDGERHQTLQIGVGPLSVVANGNTTNGIEAKNPYLGIGLSASFPRLGASYTNYRGHVTSGIFVNGQFCIGECLSLQTNLFHPISSFSIEPGMGTPQIGGGINVVGEYDSNTFRPDRFDPITQQQLRRWHPGYPR